MLLVLYNLSLISSVSVTEILEFHVHSQYVTFYKIINIFHVDCVLKNGWPILPKTAENTFAKILSGSVDLNMNFTLSR